jgi:hypothetical protein
MKSTTRKFKEEAVVNFVKRTYVDAAWRWDERIEDAISYRRPDLFLDLGFRAINVEIDENKHSMVKNAQEYQRMMELVRDVQYRPLVILRFNPDAYTEALNSLFIFI